MFKKQNSSPAVSVDETMIKSFSFSQKEILSGIQNLYCPDGFDLDPTYGHGGFYSNQKELFPGTGKIQRPKLYFDRYRDTHGAWKADARKLPIKSRSVKSVIIDPPFLAGGGHGCHMIGKYGQVGGNDNPQDVWDLYKAIMTECERVLKPYGHLVVKCQDLLHGRTQYMTHVEVTNYAIDLGLYPKDTFILLSRSRMRPHNQKTQHHARKYHSYFLVFSKAKRSVGYSRDPRSSGQRKEI